MYSTRTRDTISYIIRSRLRGSHLRNYSPSSSESIIQRGERKEHSRTTLNVLAIFQIITTPRRLSAVYTNRSTDTRGIIILEKRSMWMLREEN